MSNDEKKIQKSIQFSATTSLSLKNFLNDCPNDVAGPLDIVNAISMTNRRTVGTVIIVNAMAMTNRMTVGTVMIIKETTAVTDDAAWVGIDMLEEGMTVRLTVEAMILMCDQKTGNIPIAMIIVNAMAVTIGPLEQ